MSTPAIQITNLSVVLDHHFEALRDITASLPASRIIGFIGPSGAGKTTLMRCLVGRQHITRGSVEILGEPAGSPKLRGRVSYMTQETSVYTDLSVYDNLKYFAIMFGLPRHLLAEDIGHILETVELTGHTHQLVSTLSGGQKQRVSLAIALIGNPEVLVLDEPTVGLDPVLRESLWRLFRQISANGATLIVSSHVMDEAERCDELILLRNSRLLAHGSPRQLCTNTHTKTVEQAFLKLVGGAS